jgi:phospholipase C
MTQWASLKVTLATLGACLILSGFAGSSRAATATPIQHVVIIFQENTSFDRYFGAYPDALNPSGEPKFTAKAATPSVNGLSDTLQSANPNLFQPFRLDRSEAYTCDMDHNYTDEQKAFNGGLMNLFVQATGHVGLGCRPNGSTIMGYFDGNTVMSLWNYAQSYALNDNSFGSTFGPSTIGAINLVSGQTGGANLYKKGGLQMTNTTLFVDRDPAFDDCGADQGGTNATAVTARLTGKNVGDLLNAGSVTWGWFQGGFAPTTAAAPGSPAVCATSHKAHPGVPNPTARDGQTKPPTDIHVTVTDYVPHHAAFMFYASTANPHHLPPTSAAMIGHTDQANHQYDISAFFSALSADNLPAVSYLKAPAYEDGHPGNSDPLTEQTYLVQVINALMKASAWSTTAVFIQWDDSDGWYDHVPGPIVNPSASAGVDSFIPNQPLVNPQTAKIADPAGIQTSGICGIPASGAVVERCGYGPRLPFLTLSPYARVNFVDHSVIDQTSSLRFIEDNWDLSFIDGSAAPAAGHGSFDRIAGSVMNMFDFEKTPNKNILVLDGDTGETLFSGPKPTP